MEKPSPPYEYCTSCIAVERCSRYKRYMAGDNYQIPEWCKAKYKLDHALTKANIPFEYQGATLDTFVQDEHNLNVHKVLSRLTSINSEGEGILEKIDSGKFNIILWGKKWGTGKTYAASSILHEYIMKAVNVPGKYDFEVPLAMFVEFPDLMDRIRKAQFNEDLTLADYINDIKNSPLVLFDDIGANKITEYVHDQAYLILNARFRNRKASIFTSNIDPNSLHHIIGGDNASRILRGAVQVEVAGKDRRIGT